jgi:predicted dehydrogenase
MRFSVAVLLFTAGLAQDGSMQLIIVDPGHFHASLLQKEMYPALAPRVSVYAPLGPDVLDYLSRVSLFNSRKENPTRWEMDVHLSADPMAEMLRDHHGNIVVLTGRNRAKIDRILASLDAGLHVLADKPWIISSSDLPKLEKALRMAAEKHVAAYDIMTERYEVTSELQRVFVNDPEVFGTLEAGSASDPGIRAHSIHHVMKTVAGVPLRRPPWFFDIAEYGEGLADVGTHVVDLVQWTAFPDQPIDYRRDIRMLEGRRWPLTLTAEQFAQVTGEAHASGLDYFCNNAVHYTIRGVHVKLEIRWNWEAPEGSGDVYEAVFRGSQARAEIRQSKADHYIPELYVVPGAASRAQVFAAVGKRIAALQARWPGLGMAESGNDIRVVIPEKFRVGHEAHFAQVTNRFFEYVKSPESMPDWETACMLAKYYVSTTGVELSKSNSRGTP